MPKEKGKLEAVLNYRFINEQLIVEALTHRSCKMGYNNERLEFLGDAVLDLVVGEYLFNRFPDYDEGFLSKIRASLVNEKGFKKLADALELGEYIHISAAEENNNGREKPSILSNAFEAVMGAVYLDGGLEEVRRMVYDLLQQVYPRIDLDALFNDHKTRLQEITQARYGITPDYDLLSSTGPDHKKEFLVRVSIEGKEYASGKGGSKKAAQQEAARLTITMLEEGE